jgi:thiol-disulfide isomerase/thioredoxin
MKLVFSIFVKAVLIGAAFALFSPEEAAGQKAASAKRPRTAAVKDPKVTQIDLEKLKAILKPNGKPLLVNFWATWCDPCREEFPDLVKLHTAYRDRVDFVTVSIDDLAEINSTVPKFLGEMKSEMPAFLLKAADDDAAIRYVSKDWSGNLPLTIIYTADGSQAFFKNAKFEYANVTQVLDGLLSAPTAPAAPNRPDQSPVTRP